MRKSYHSLGFSAMCGTIALRPRTNLLIRPRGEMDITTVFGTVVGGSNPSEGTKSFVKSKSALYSPDCFLIIVMRVSFSGRTRPCQGRDGSSILPARTYVRYCTPLARRLRVLRRGRIERRSVVSRSSAKPRGGAQSEASE